MSTRVVTASRPGLFGAAWGIFSDCERYRYLLAVPTGAGNERVCSWALANPSTATPDELDPTLRRVIGYSKAWGFGWAWVVNVRAWRETNPKLVPDDPLAIGPNNDSALLRATLGGETIVCGWGKLHGERQGHVLELIHLAGKTPHALRLTQAGEPAHPLYLPKNLKPFPMGAK